MVTGDCFWCFMAGIISGSGQAGMRAALVTLLIGERYADVWRRYCEPSWRMYANRHGFNLLVHDKIIDATADSRHSLAWQKLLVGTLDNVQEYSHLVWIDSDIIINSAMAPNILTGVAEGKIGAVRYHALLSQPLFETAHRQICGGRSAHEFNTALFQHYGVQADPRFLLNTGVLVIPRSCWSFLAGVYAKYKSHPLVHPQQQEQVPLSYEMYANGLTHFLDDKFNAVWYEYKHGVYFGDGPREFNRSVIQKILSQVWFLHFAGNHQDMMLLQETSHTSNSAVPRMKPPG